jgi:uncharacterized protein
MPIREWSVKISAGWPDDDPVDVSGSAWAGVVPFHGERLGDPQPAPDLREGIPVPESVRAMCAARPPACLTRGVAPWRAALLAR